MRDHDTNDYRQLAEEALARAEAAMPGPWVTNDAGYPTEDRRIVIQANEEYLVAEIDDGGMEPPDANFIAASRTDVPALARAVLELSRELEGYREATAAYEFYSHPENQRAGRRLPNWRDRLKALAARAPTEPLEVDISDQSDDYAAGYLAGQVNALEVATRPQMKAWSPD